MSVDALFSFSSFFFWLLFLSLSEGILVGLDDAHEVGVQGEEDGGLKQHLEEVVLLLELLVLVLGNSVADEDLVLLVDGRVVDHIPDSDQTHRDQREDDSGGELSSAAEGVLDEPVHEESGSQVKWDQKHNGHHWEPPGNLIVEDQEEVPRDVVEGQNHSKATNELDSKFDGAAAAASQLLGSVVLADAQAAAAA